ncbi:MAG: biotin transporter BioY [Anaerolineae bacterium]|nr:biotin transporter BioY [Anaerolineae bacterium]
MSYMTYSDVLRPAVKKYAILYDLFTIVGFSWLVALGARISIPLPFTPVPITGQTFAVLLSGVVLGSRRGALSLLMYLAYGAMGLPVFSMGRGGLAHLFGPTAGYLWGFVAAAFITGLLAERGWDRKVVTAFLAMLLGNVVIYACGLPWLARYVGYERVLAAGLLPFIAGDVLKLLLATALLPSGWKLIGRTTL